MFKKISSFSTSFEGGEVDLSDLDNVMQNMGIEPTPKEHLELVNLLPVYGEYFKYQHRFQES